MIWSTKPQKKHSPPTLLNLIGNRYINQEWLMQEMKKEMKTDANGIQIEDFDVNDPKNLGRPLYWIFLDHVRAICQMIRADELQIAIKMCDDIPGWYRKNYPPELADLKKILYQQCYDQFDYASDFDEAHWNYDDIIAQCFTNYTYPRADILAQDIKKLNDKQRQPWIFEISPSHGWLPLGFAHYGLKFNFFGKNLNQKALTKIIQHLPKDMWQEQPLGMPGEQLTALVCYESLEHSWDPNAIVQSAYKVGVTWDYIYLSTPNGTLGGGLPDWDTRRLGHVRTWTPKEFTEWASTSWPGYTWEIFESHSMVLKGSRI